MYLPILNWILKFSTSIKGVDPLQLRPIFQNKRPFVSTIGNEQNNKQTTTNIHKNWTSLKVPSKKLFFLKVLIRITGGLGVACACNHNFNLWCGCCRRIRSSWPSSYLGAEWVQGSLGYVKPVQREGGREREQEEEEEKKKTKEKSFCGSPPLLREYNFG